MAPFRQYSFAATGVRSLCWRGDELVDCVGGGRAFALDGTERPRPVSYGYRFDAATASPDGRFAVIYERLGTKGLLLEDGTILREIDRSFYHAEAYDYPVALFREPGGRLLLAHCPGRYSRLELEDAETGRRLTDSVDRKPSDFFHSGLVASPHGKRLLSAGWVWHPWSVVACFDVEHALADPRQLDGGAHASPYWGANVCMAEGASACWLDDDCIVVAASAEPEDDEEPGAASDGPRLRPCGVAVYDLAGGRCLRAVELAEQAGTILPIGRHHVLSLYRHPKLIDLSTAKVLYAWTELASGVQSSSIIWGLKDDQKPPPMAFDPPRGRFAIVNGDRITVIEFDLSALGSR